MLYLGKIQKHYKGNIVSPATERKSLVSFDCLSSIHAGHRVIFRTTASLSRACTLCCLDSHTSLSA